MSQTAGQIRLVQLASIAAQGQRERFDEIYSAVASLVEFESASFSSRERSLIVDILRRLSKDVEMSHRIRVAERLADNANAPHEIILMLVDDTIDVAEPVLTRSPLLTTLDLIRVIENGTREHRIAVARRPNIEEPVSEALNRTELEAVLDALLRNETARIGKNTFADLVERARTQENIGWLLAERPDLPPELARLMSEWVSDEIKTVLSRRFPQEAALTSQAVREAFSDIQQGRPASEVSATKLVAKLVSAGQLRASFVMRVLHQGQMELFEHGFAALLGLEVDVMRRALYGERPHTVALACRAAGIDRSVFGTVFNMSRHNKRLRQVLSQTDHAEIAEIFIKLGKPEALQRLKNLLLS